ncbi:hypothetical protein SteCoe_17075 [Stentor coeruleus]|uniref:Ubiquitin carboxyl-terminal hydrolase n=1 Tax=Stentor coeruleus TaxID=5963 RepID=A0A1R2BZW4_9CILI|nr:hypothetical protein SteCoe_17075 [Stentor coeruleus]
MESCKHFDLVNVQQQVRKLSSPQIKVISIKDSIRIGDFYCEKCSVSFPNIWICLHNTCTFRGCGRYQNKHAQQHYSSFKHFVFINPETLLIWCLECDQEIIEVSSIALKSVFESNNTFKKIEMDQKPKDKDIRGVVGLRNLGNTCFMNSSLQCLFNIRAFQRYFLKTINIEELKAQELPEFEVIQTLTELINNVWNEDSPQASPMDFWDAFRKSCPFFKGMAQHDSQEFLRILLDKLHEELKFEYQIGKHRSIVSDIFCSELQNKIICKICGNYTVKDEEFYDLSVSIPTADDIESYKEVSKGVRSPQERFTLYSEKSALWSNIQQIFTENKEVMSIYDCLLNFCLPEELRQKFECLNCGGKMPSRREVKILKPPNTLMLVIKRFKYNKGGMKISTYVQFPMSIDLRFFLSRNSSCQYQLNGMIQHMGGVNGGHYVSYCKNFKNNNWYEYDDLLTRQITEQELLEKEAYILFYQRQISEPREKLRKGQKKAFLPSYWYNLYRTLSDPGTIYTKYLLCSHRMLKPLFSLSQFKEINVAQAEEIKKKFTQDSSIIEKIGDCESCLSSFAKLNTRIELELELIKELNEITPFEGPWYLISTTWLNHWKSFCCHGSSSEKCIPIPIDNSTLFLNNKIKKSLEKGKDYRGVNRHVWEALLKLYKGGPEIKRLEVDIYAEPAPEIICTTPSLTADHMNKLRIIKSTYNND